jgi:hypothetical protein
MKLEIIERFEIEGRGTVFYATVEPYNGENLIGRVFSHKGEYFQIRDMEMQRSGIFERPNQKKSFGLVVRKLDSVLAE